MTSVDTEERRYRADNFFESQISMRLWGTKARFNFILVKSCEVSV